MRISTLNVIGYNSFILINSFVFFWYKSLSDQICPCLKIGCQPRVNILISLVEPKYPMKHTKFHSHQPFCSWDDFQRFFLHIWPWWPSWSCDPDPIIKLHSPIKQRLHMWFGFHQPSSFRGEEHKNTESEASRTKVNKWSWSLVFIKKKSFSWLQISTLMS